MKKKLFLYTPIGYDSLTINEKKRICNGCGSLWGGILIPDTIYGLNISEACNIHDYMYKEGTSKAYKKIADDWFKKNLYRIIDYYSANKFMRWLRKRRANKYYWAVTRFGNRAYFKVKI